MFKWLLKKGHTILAWEKENDDGCSPMVFGYSDENTDANVLATLMEKAFPHVESWCDLEYISISSEWKLFNRFEFFRREIFLHDLDPDA